MLKATVAAALFILCSYIGILKEKRLRQHSETLKSIINELNAFVAMLCYRPLPIKKFAMERTDIIIKPLWKHFSEIVDEKGTASAWTAAIEFSKTQRNGISSLDDDEIRLLRSLGNTFSFADIEIQIRDIKNIARQLEENEKRLSEEHLKKGKAYRSIGIIAGLALTIILL